MDELGHDCKERQVQVVERNYLLGKRCPEDFFVLKLGLNTLLNFTGQQPGEQNVP